MNIGEEFYPPGPSEVRWIREIAEMKYFQLLNNKTALAEKSHFLCWTYEMNQELLGFSKQTSTVRQFSATAQSPGPFENLSPKGNTVTSPFQKSHYGLETSRFSGVSIEQSKSNELNKLRKNEIIQEELDKIDHHDADDHDPYREEIQENTLNEEVQTDDSLTPTRTLQSEGTQTEEHPLPGGELTNLANQFNEGMDLIQQKRIPYTSRILNLSTDAKIQPTPRSVMPSRLSVVHRGFDTLGESVDFSGMSLKRIRELTRNEALS